MAGVDQLAFETARRVAQTSYSKLIAYIAKRTRDVAGAEDALSEAFAAALKDWPGKGVPEKPEAWLLAVARRKLIDRARQKNMQAARVPHLQLLTEELDQMIARERHIPDERLGLMFACAHPAMDEGTRAPLILQTILGLTAEDIGAAFLLPGTTMGQRLARAKAKIKLAGVPLRVPEKAELPERLDAVLDAVYAAFSAAWIDLGRSGDLAGEAIWLGRLICHLLPEEPEALGLLALMLIVHARRGARRGTAGEFVPLSDQDVTLWDVALTDEAAKLLLKAEKLGVIGRYQIEAAIQAVHASRRSAGVTDWPSIALLYDGLFGRFASPVVAVNRAVAHGEAHGAETGLAMVPDLQEHPELARFQPYWAALAALLAGTGQTDAADRAFDKAIELATDSAQMAFLQGKRAALRPLPENVRVLRAHLPATART